ncbi:BnaA08g07770D [Brassica napus]|uniref:BnaA08g07770D protein n=2 Tax=Brassica TaxID=3705 RepID=A0A078GPJ5_BRANA|nr:BnaA08g07770D [Brassica napus]VDD03569.1 unnamed protein product [Brassica rapa]
MFLDSTSLGVLKMQPRVLVVYSTLVPLLLTAVVFVYLFSFHVSLTFFLGSSKLTAFASVLSIQSI